MISPSQLFHGVEGVWLVWLASVLVVLKMSWLALRRWRRPYWAELARGEDGVSYSLSYVLVFPFYFLFVCLVFEATWILVAKIGTMYAAHAGARSAVVWLSAQPQDLQTERINQSVWMAMTPFVTNVPSKLVWDGAAVDYAIAYDACARANGDPNARPAQEVLSNRYIITTWRTTWTKQVDTSKPDGDVTVSVTYRASLLIPGVARIFDPDGQAPYEYPITSSATMPNEAPANDSRTLGINYKSK